MRIFICSFLIYIVSVFFSAAYTADDVNKNTGTSAAQFLKIPIGARPAAVADSHVAIADDANAVIVNPAGMGFLFMPELQAMHGFWLGEMYYDFVAYVHPTPFGTFGGAVQYFSGPKMTKIEDGVVKGKFRTYDAAGTLSYGKKIIDYVAAGINIKVLQTKLDEETSSVPAADIGIKYKTENDLFSFGLIGKNLGGKMKFIDDSDPLPFMIQAGFGSKISLPKHHSDFTLSAQAHVPRDNTPFYSVGIEHVGAKIFALRAGYVIDPAKNELDALACVRAGIGFMIRDFVVDYALRPFDVLGNTHLITMGWRFSQFGSKKTFVTASLRADPQLFSPNDDGVKDATFLIPALPPELEEIKKWNIDIRDNIGARVKTIEGEDIMPSILSWDGKNEHNVIVGNGTYLCVLEASGEGHIEALAPEISITIDITPPEISLVLSTGVFSPDRDGIDDTLIAAVEASDINGISRWQLNIINQQGRFVKVIKSSETLPRDVEWDGKDDYYMNNVPGGYYDIQLFAWDNAGNRNSTAINSVQLLYEKEYKNIDVQEESRGLVVNLTSKVLFGSGKGELQPESQQALDELVELLKNYPENEVAIEGHTDNIGSEQGNYALSSKRAWNVYSYLVKHGIDARRLKPKGFGESKPVTANNTAAGREKNRRVEIIILKTPTKEYNSEN